MDGIFQNLFNDAISCALSKMQAAAQFLAESIRKASRGRPSCTAYSGSKRLKKGNGLEGHHYQRDGRMRLSLDRPLPDRPESTQSGRPALAIRPRTDGHGIQKSDWLTKPIESIVILRDNTPMKCKRNSDGRAIDHHSLQVMRQQAIKAVREGQTVQSVAAAFGVNIRSVFRWLSDFANGGQNALLAKPVPGRPPRISAEEMRWLAQAVRDHSPLQYRFEFGLWTLSLIAELIRRQFGKTLSLSAVSRIMKLLGFTAQKNPCIAPGSRMRRWCASGKARPTRRFGPRPVQRGARIYFADESGLRSDYHAGTTWALQGETPVVEVTGRRFSVNMLSAVGTRGEFRFMLHDGTVTASVFREFLKRLLIGAEQPVFVIVDGHPVHKARLVRAFVEEQAGRLKLFHLPPYSPQLNRTSRSGGARQAQCLQASCAEPGGNEEVGPGRAAQNPEVAGVGEIVFFRHPDCRYTAA
ncbi:IS630 family transposase [Azotobacter vinelandii]